MNVIPLNDHKKRTDGGGQRAGEVISLPVAPHVTAMTRFSSSLPRRMSFMMPGEALSYLEREIDRGVPIDMVAITGPGDPLGVPDTTMKTLELVRSRLPDVALGLKTLGFGTEKFAAQLADVGVSYVEMIVNGVKEEIVEKLYAWIRPGQKTLKIGDAAALLIREQKNGVPALKYHNIAVSIWATLYPGLNDKHIGRISRAMMELGADSISVLPYQPEQGSEVVCELPDSNTLKRVSKAAGKYLPVITPRLSSVCSGPPTVPDALENQQIVKRTELRPNVAVMSSNGVDIDMHLGKVDKILIYGLRDDGLACLLETRIAPSSGGGVARWRDMAYLLNDCFVVLAAQAGEIPRQVLSENGLSVMLIDDQIEGVVDVLYGGSKKQKTRKQTG